jgi:hypothetical protein
MPRWVSAWRWRERSKIRSKILSEFIREYIFLDGNFYLLVLGDVGFFFKFRNFVLNGLCLLFVRLMFLAKSLEHGSLNLELFEVFGTHCLLIWFKLWEYKKWQCYSLTRGSNENDERTLCIDNQKMLEMELKTLVNQGSSYSKIWN